MAIRLEWRYTRDTWLDQDQVPTLGSFTRLPPDKLEMLLEGTGTAVNAMGGGFTMGYATVVVTTTRADAT